MCVCVFVFLFVLCGEDYDFLGRQVLTCLLRWGLGRGSGHVGLGWIISATSLTIREKQGRACVYVAKG